MAVPRETVWKRDPHTAEKHAILRGYLNAWWPIILQSFSGATYAEGFAGPGEYKDGEDGSPIEALHALLDRPNPLPEKPARFMLVEEREDRVQHLGKVLEDRYPTLPSHVDVRPRQGSCEHRLLPELDEAGAWGEPVFAMLDPFNVEVPYPVIQRIGANRSSEVLVTFMSSWLTRWASDEDQDQGDRMFGDRQWRKVAYVPTDDKKPWLVSLYRRRLTQAGFRFQTAFELVNPGGQAFFLVFATNSKLGVEKMKEAMWARDRVHGVRFRDPRSPDQLSFDIEDHPDLRGLERLLADHLEVDQPTPVETVREWTLLETAFRPPHAQDVLKRWAGGEYLEVVDGGRLRKGSTVVLRRRTPLGPAPPPKMF
ncbi:MAG: three-Cys-motif partner protein TcmP [Actinomycetota bacterium]|nr:three-Cys-motif partner protein TcmP [Actinomycetota bacterium]